ncbi:GlsB/YeaQ/YmgE family stress response membrane protein [Janthinobacterium sp.]|uniref:GlsB/YeaQ/YmgE family stress response membrane protein n=1 Tax=Janthinobacterium sp. TaxID=1871054 RepID=UPI00293D24C0|nr:GlsB/YeaQ/YmgE family stress response membrane protein [Janthinobacterium sp.]
MGCIIWMVVGGSMGWLASMLMLGDTQDGIFLNIVIGILGAFLAGLLLAPLFDGASIAADDFSPLSLLVSLLGASAALTLATLLPRDRLP